jgi:hypothetical protein
MLAKAGYVVYKKEMDGKEDSSNPPFLHMLSL